MNKPINPLWYAWESSQMNVSQHLYPIFCVGTAGNKGSSWVREGLLPALGDKPRLISALHLTAGKLKDRSEWSEPTINTSLFNRTAHLIPANPFGQRDSSGVWNNIIRKAHSWSMQEAHKDRWQMTMASILSHCFAFNWQNTPVTAAPVGGHWCCKVKSLVKYVSFWLE